ncbi:hypothetical protein vBBceSLY5_0002 [Bacillus phage vB_BceS_LY5]|nr:hypothetical protein vBBceSLY5_0002 [Bacillus phage vB_BceS_LY5]
MSICNYNSGICDSAGVSIMTKEDKTYTAFIMVSFIWLLWEVWNG